MFGNNFLYKNLEFLRSLAWSGLDQCKYSRSTDKGGQGRGGGGALRVGG